jgi:hypothetical protein
LRIEQAGYGITFRAENSWIPFSDKSWPTRLDITPLLRMFRALHILSKLTPLYLSHGGSVKRNVGFNTTPQHLLRHHFRRIFVES